jgi:hypothetical protein
MTYIYNSIRNLSLSLAIIAMAVTGVSPAVQAQTTVTPDVSVTPATAADSSSTPLYGIGMTSCLEVFNWVQYMADLNAGITNSNPYDKKGCVRDATVAINGSRTVTKNAQGQVTAVSYNVGSPIVSKTKYNQFTIGQATTKAAFGELPVLGVFPNAGLPAQALNTYEITGAVQQAVAPVDRSIKEGLPSIFPEAKLAQIYTTGGDRNGVPRSPYTGPATFGANGSWLGGMCVVRGGKLVTRSTGDDRIPFNGNFFTPESYGLNNNTPITTCSWPNTAETVNAGVYDPEGVVKDNLLQVYQFTYQIPYPTDYAQCTALFPGSFANYEACIGWFRTRYSKPLTGTATGNSLYYTYTYYGTWNDVYTGWIGWENPDINKARRNFVTTATEAELRAFFGDNTTSAALLKERYEAFVRGADGYSVYAI